MQKDDKRVLTFATLVCVTSSLLLSAAASSLRNRQENNIILDRKINVLQAFGEEVKDERGRKIASADRVQELFNQFITEVVLDAATGEIIDGLAVADVSESDLEQKNKLPLFLWNEDGEVTRYAFPISGRGLWSTIRGFVALDRDLATILGVTFYDHGETPGLGAEIDRPWFQNNFVGKRLWEDGELLSFKVWKGAAPDDHTHAVDGISGATITGNGVTQFLNEDMARYDKFFRTIRET